MTRDFVFDPNAPDAGYWEYDSINNVWAESDPDSFIDWENWSVRKKNENTTHSFFIDGFPRQANRTLRRLLLDCFPHISITKDLLHREKFFYNAIKENEVCLLSIRSPYDSISSLYSYMNLDMSNKDLLIQEIKYYNRMTSLAIGNNNIYAIDFNDIINYPYLILSKIETQFNIPKSFADSFKYIDKTKSYEEGHNSTRTKEIDKFIISNKTLFTEAEELYKKAKEKRLHCG